MNRHKALEKGRQSSETLDHVKRLQRIRQLMEADPGLSFDSAFTRVMQEESNASPAVKTAQSAPSHGQDRLMLVKGAERGMLYPIFK